MSASSGPAVRWAIAGRDARKLEDAQKSYLSFSTRFPQSPLRAQALQRLLANLIDNALSFSPEAGVVAVTMRRLRNEIVITVSDDGIGLDLPALRAEGISKGLLDPGREASDAELAELIFAPGFSTAESVSRLAGFLK